MDDSEPVIKKKKISIIDNQISEQDTNENQESKQQIEESKFNALILRKKLKDPNTAFHAVKLLITEDPSCDKIEEYINAKGGPIELLQIINKPDIKKNFMYVAPVFSAVQLVIVKIVSKYPLLHKWAEEECSHLLSEFMPTTHLMLQHNSPVNHKIIVLKLLSSVVSLSTKLAKLIVNSINLEYSHVEHLYEQVNPHDRKSVHVTFIHFILSFIIEGNASLIQQLLQNKGLMRLLLKDLTFDNSTTVTFLLTALRDNVVNNLMIPKSLKMRSFNTSVLISILELYNWLGPKHWISKKMLPADLTTIIYKGDEEERNEVRQSVHSLLVLLCTSHKFGIAFLDKNVGIGPCQNIMIRSIFKDIEKHWEDDLVKDLLSSILSANPDLIKTTFVSLKNLFEPRASKNWMATVDFIYQVTNRLDPVICLPTGFGIRETIKIVKHLCLSSPVLQTVCSEESFKNSNVFVRTAAIKYFEICLKKVNQFLLFSSFRKSVLAAIIKHLNEFGPKPEWIITSWNMKTVSSDDFTSSIVESDKEYNLHFINSILLMHEISPNLVDFDDKCSRELIIKMFTECNNLKSEDSQDSHNFKLYTLKFVNVIKTLNPNEDCFNMYIQMFIELMGTDLKNEAKMEFEKLLLRTGLMEDVEDEAEMWIHCLTRNGAQLLVKDFFQDIIIEAASNTALLFKIISDACSSTTSNYLSKSAVNIDDILELLDDESDSADDKDEDEDNPKKSTKIKDNYKCNVLRNRQSLSPLVPAMLRIFCNQKLCQKYAQDENNITARQNFVISVLVYSMHRQIYPERLQKLLTRDLIGCATAALSYVSSWTEPGLSPHPLTFNPFDENSIESKLSKFFLKQEKKSKFMCEVLDLLEDPSFEANPKILLNLCIFYITQLYQRNNLTENLIKKSIKIISKLLSLIDHSSLAFKSILQGVLVHPIIVKMFQPLKKDLFIELTKIVLLFINAANTSIKDKDELCVITFTCKNKFLKSINRASKKQKELNCFNLSPVLQDLTLTINEIYSLFCHVIHLPRSVLESGWLEIEARLLNESTKNGVVLTAETILKITSQIVELNGKCPIDLKLGICNYIKRFPHFIKYINKDLFSVLLNEDVVEESNLQLAKLLLSINKNLSVEAFETHKVKSPCLLFPLLSVCMGDSLAPKKLNKLLSKQMNNLLEGIVNQSPWFTENYSFIATLLETNLEKERKVEFYNSLKSEWNKMPKNINVIQILKSIVVDNSIIIRVVGDLFDWFIELSENNFLKEHSWLPEGILLIIENYSGDVNWSHLLSNSNCKEVILISLKLGLNHDFPCSANLLKLLVILCSKVFSKENEVSEIFNRLVSHSDFISVMLTNNQLTYYCVDLLLVLIKVNPKLTASSHIPIYLSSYGATLSNTDQKLLQVLQFYEKNGSSVWEWRPCLWGSTAANFYSVHSKSAQPLWRQPRMSQVLSLLDKDLVDKTISNFPLKRSLQDKNVIIIENGDKIYDPAFILPLLAHLLASGADVQYRFMVNTGALALTIASLASDCNDLRSVAYLVLTRFHSHLSSDIKDQQLWLNFIDAVRGGVLELTEECPQIPCIVTTFLAQTSLILSSPMDPLFTTLNTFLLAKPYLNLSTIPALLELLQNKEVQYRDHQEWILKVLRDGTRQKTDMKLIFQSMAFKVLLSLYSFVHTPKELKVLILEILLRAITIQDAGYLLVTNYGLISWISNCITDKDSIDVSLIIRVLEKVTNLKKCSLHVKLLCICLVKYVTSIPDLERLLIIFSNPKIICHLNITDIKIILDVLSNHIGKDSVKKSKYMLEYGCDYVTDIKDANAIIENSNYLVFNFLKNVKQST